MSSRTNPRKRNRRVVGVGAVAIGAILSTYAGALRSFSYARVVSPAAASCSAGATLVSDDTQLQAAVASSVDDSVICVTADIVLSATIAIDDTTLTLEGREVGGRDPVLSGDHARRIINADFTDNSSDDTLTVRDLVLVQGRANGQGGALLLQGGNRSDALELSGVEVAGNYSTQDGGGVSASNLASVYVGNSNFHDDTVGNAGLGDISGGALKIADTAQTTIADSAFRDNSSVEWGGAVFLKDSGVTRISGSTFERNSSGTNAGGAIEVDIDDSTLPGAIYFTSSVFRDNSSTSGAGGAVRVTDNDDTVSFASVTFDGNSTGTSSGGGLNISFQSGPVFLTDITALDNLAGSSGGFLRVSDFSSTLTIERLNSQRNVAASDGGSIKQTSGSLDVSDSTFSDDSVGLDGGAIESSNALRLDIVDSTFTGNLAGRDGGAIMTTDDSDITISASRFASNSAADDGGAIEINDARNVYVDQTVFQLNAARGDDGGGLLVSGADDTVSLSTVTFDRNSAVGEGGGVKTLSHQGPFTATGLTITGNTSGSDGGGMYLAPDEAIITGGVFTGNLAQGASADGGAIYLRNALRHEVTSSTFTGNAAGSRGGSIYIDSNDSTNDTTVLSNLTFTDDSASIDGGSVFARVEGPITMSSLVASGTRSGDDGGFAYLRSDDTSVVSADFSLSDIRVTDSAATANVNSDAGALWIGQANELHLTDVSVAGSTAAGDGGGAFLTSIVDVMVETSSFVNNAAGDFTGGLSLGDIYSSASVAGTTLSGNSSTQDGAGLYVELAAGAALSVVNSTLVNNATASRSSDVGGGLFLNGDTGSTASLDFVTVTGNSANRGGGSFVNSNVATTISNSIISGNSSDVSGADLWVAGSASLDDSYSLFTSAGSVSGATADGPGTLFGAPKLNGLADNGGPTSTMLPQWDSPAFEAGDPTWTAPPPNDQRGAGFPRNAGGRVSMGAIQGRSARPVDPAFPPSSPREVTAIAADQQAVVSWTAPASTGSFPVTNYQLDDSTGEVSALVAVRPGEPLSTLVEGLENGREYAFRVRALNGAGWGPWSVLSNTVTPSRERSILITGTRDGRYARVSGETTGLVGESLVPRVRLPGPQRYKDGESRPVVDEAGEFTWQRQGGKRTYVYFVTEDGGLRSKRVIIRAQS